MTKVKKEAITHLESQINHLWGELNTANIPHNVRLLLEHEMQEVEDEFKHVVTGKNSSSKLQKKLEKIDVQLATAAITQAENEISKTEHDSAQFQGLENVQRTLKEKEITPNQARHEVKKITRRH